MAVTTKEQREQRMLSTYQQLAQTGTIAAP